MAPLIERHPDWHRRLDEFVGSAAGYRFWPGKHDCGLFAATAVMVQSKHGIDFAAEFRGRYTTIEEGLSLLQAAGYADHVALAADKLNEVAPAMARLGDIAVVDSGAAGLSLVIVGGQHLVGPMPGMRGSVPRLLAIRAFAVGWMPEAEDAPARPWSTPDA